MKVSSLICKKFWLILSFAIFGLNVKIGFALAPPIISDILKTQENKIASDIIKFTDEDPSVLVQAIIKILNEPHESTINRQLAFELASLLMSDERSFLFSLSFSLFKIHHYTYYKELMAIYGLSIIIASEYKKDIKAFFNKANPQIVNWNDMQRNFNRIAGFFHDEEKASDFVKLFKSQIDDKKEPWYIDSQIAILDVLEAINYKKASMRKYVIRKLDSIKNNSKMSSIVRERVKEVITSLKHQNKKYIFIAFYSDALKEFSFFQKSNLIENFQIIKELRSIMKNVPTDDFGRVDKERLKEFCFGKKCIDRQDPVDIYAFGSQYEMSVDSLRKALDKVRIDYNEILNLVLPPKSKKMFFKPTSILSTKSL